MSELGGSRRRRRISACILRPGNIYYDYFRSSFFKIVAEATSQWKTRVHDQIRTACLQTLPNCILNKGF